MKLLILAIRGLVCAAEHSVHLTGLRLQKNQSVLRVRAAIGSGVWGADAALCAIAQGENRDSYPGADERELRVRLAVRLYGRDCARRLFGHVPDDAT